MTTLSMAVEVFQRAELAFGERMKKRGVLFDPSLSVEAGLIAALAILERPVVSGDSEVCQHCRNGKQGYMECYSCNGTGNAPTDKPNEVKLALDYSRNFAHANPNLTNTAKEHILGLCDLLEKYAALESMVRGKS